MVFDCLCVPDPENLPPKKKIPMPGRVSPWGWGWGMGAAGKNDRS